MARILYIAGYGRSGSTALAAVLGAHPQMLAIGEAGFAAADWLDPSRECSCGRPYAECDLWAPMVAAWRQRPGDLARIRAADRIGTPLRRLDRLDRRSREAYHRFHAHCFGHALRATGKSVIVDSSKSARLTARRAVALARVGGHDVRVLHLVRDGRATVRSLVRGGSNWVMEGHRARYRFAALRAVAGWLWVNLYADRLRSELGPDRYLRLRYEDFIARPAETVDTIARFIGVDPTALTAHLRSDGEFPIGHMIGGNRLRFAGSIRLRAPDRGADASADLGPGARLLFACVAGALNHVYGYRNAAP